MVRLAVTVAALLAAQAAADPPEVGRAIYEDGMGGKDLSATMGTPPWPIAPRARACAACHGATGRGASEGGVAAPPIDLSALSDVQAVERLAAALRDGRGAGGRSLLAAMPRYVIGTSDLTALARYVRGFPYPAQRGMSGSSLAIGLDLAGSGFLQTEQARLRARFNAALARINGEGGLFGRVLTLAETPADAFLSISWSGLDDRRSLAIVPRLPGRGECAQCCATLHAGVDAQLEWLNGWLATRKVTATYRGSLSDSFPRPPRLDRANATIFLGFNTELARPPAGGLYLFADLGRPDGELNDRPGTYVVTAIDVAAQSAAVRALTAAESAYADTPRLASAAIEIDRALDFMIDALGKGGRRTTALEVCRALGDTVPAAHVFSVLDMNSSAVVATSRTASP